MQANGGITYHQRSILAAMRSVKLDLCSDPEEKESLMLEVLAAILRAGFLICKPQTLELEICQQIRSCLQVAHYQLAQEEPSAANDLASHKIEAAIATVQMLDDYLRELQRLGTIVPLTWREFVQGRYSKNRLQNADICDNVENATNDAN